ncbi:MAG: hypothetical protein DRJ41_01745 [Thermoprotei archaeon]|nr:MAG: hypothetical protein DRJ41_01745 [Thermoprotei archaeon]
MEEVSKILRYMIVIIDSIDSLLIETKEGTSVSRALRYLNKIRSRARHLFRNECKIVTEVDELIGYLEGSYYQDISSNLRAYDRGYLEKKCSEWKDYLEYLVEDSERLRSFLKPNLVIPKEDIRMVDKLSTMPKYSKLMVKLSVNEEEVKQTPPFMIGRGGPNGEYLVIRSFPANLSSISRSELIDLSEINPYTFKEKYVFRVKVGNNVSRAHLAVLQEYASLIAVDVSLHGSRLIMNNKEVIFPGKRSGLEEEINEGCIIRLPDNTIISLEKV